MGEKTFSTLLWDAQGNEVRDTFRIRSNPDLFFDDDNDDITFNYEEMAFKVRDLSGSEVTALELISAHHYAVIDAITKDGNHFIIRVAGTDEKTDLAHVQDCLRRECEVMKWIASSTTLPIPRLFYYSVDEQYPYMITDKRDGHILADKFGLFPFEAKVANVRSYARIAIELFKMNAPEGIGSLLSFESDGSSGLQRVILGPSVTPFEPPTVVSSISDYFKWHFQAKRDSSGIGTNKEDLEEAQAVLDRLESLVFDCLSGYDPAILRCIPSHEDLGPQNVLVDSSGVITAVLDWEYHMVQPAVLAVSYPSWIRYDGRRNPRFIHPNNMSSAIWFSSPSDAAKLRNIYDEITKEMNAEYYRALKQGEFCRSATDWLDAGLADRGCQRLKAWLNSL